MIAPGDTVGMSVALDEALVPTIRQEKGRGRLPTRKSTLTERETQP